MLEPSNPNAIHQPIVNALKRVHPFQWMCLSVGIFYLVSSSPHVDSSSTSTMTRGSMPTAMTTGLGKTIVSTDIQVDQEMLSIKEFVAVNDRILDTSIIPECECGCLGSAVESCPRQYNLADVKKSANVIITREIGEYMDLRLQKRRHASQMTCLEDEYSGVEYRTDSGGYCLNAFLRSSQEEGQDRGEVILPFPDRVIPVPKGFAPASESMLYFLHSFIEKEGITSLSDFGAGIGQYGMDLERRYPNSLLYRGYDGAGDVEVYTQGFLRFFDLSIPLNLPVSDWVMSLNVGERISSHLEGMVIRNLHAHNCRGIMLSWATPGQGGLHLVNSHDNQYIINIFAELGYVYDAEESKNFHDNFTDSPWFVRSFMVLRRQNPVC